MATMAPRERIMAQTPPSGVSLDHPVLPILKGSFPQVRLRATEFRGQTSVIVEPSDLHAVLRFLRDDPRCNFQFLSDVSGIDYLNYPAAMPGRFAGGCDSPA